MTPYAKAIASAVVGFLGGLKVALVDGHVTGSEWVDIAYTTVLATGLVYAVPNARRRARPGQNADPHA